MKEFGVGRGDRGGLVLKLDFGSGYMILCIASNETIHDSIYANLALFQLEFKPQELCYDHLCISST